MSGRSPNTCRHTTLGPTNNRAISRWARGGGDSGNIGDIWVGHEVSIRTLLIVMRAGDLITRHCCYPDSGNGDIDPVGQDFEPGFCVDCCCSSGHFDCGSGCLYPDSYHSGVGHYS